MVGERLGLYNPRGFPGSYISVYLVVYFLLSIFSAFFRAMNPFHYYHNPRYLVVAVIPYSIFSHFNFLENGRNLFSKVKVKATLNEQKTKGKVIKGQPG